MVDIDVTFNKQELLDLYSALCNQVVCITDNKNKNRIMSLIHKTWLNIESIKQNEKK